jgi:hypothetical protein
LSVKAPTSRVVRVSSRPTSQRDRGSETFEKLLSRDGSRVTGSLLRSACGPCCGELRRSSGSIFKPVGFFCEYGGHDAQGGNFPLHADDIEFLLSENLENVLHGYLSSLPGRANFVRRGRKTWSGYKRER